MRNKKKPASIKWPEEKNIQKLKRYVAGRHNKDVRALRRDGLKWTRTSWANKLSYETTWLGMPIIQLPEDIVLIQEVIFKVKPDIIVESGIAHGGSLVFYASLLKLLGRGKVIGVDIEIRKHNRKAIEVHPMSRQIILIEGSSTAPDTLENVRRRIPKGAKVLVCLDANHTKNHVAQELKLYSRLVSVGSYIIVFDTIMPQLTGLPGARKNWTKDNPHAAVKNFLKENKDFKIDKEFHKFFVSYCPDGFLKKIK